MSETDTGTEWFWRIVDADGLGDVPSDEVAALRLLCHRAARAAQAEAEVARLTAALAEANVACEVHADAALDAEHWNERATAAEASASALRERVATLEAALQPFAAYAADMPGADFGEGEIGEYYHEGFRRSIRTQDLRAARTALEAPHADN